MSAKQGSWQTPRLQPRCDVRLGNNTSTFIAAGRGGTPVTPGGWLPSVNLAHPADDVEQPSPNATGTTNDGG